MWQALLAMLILSANSLPLVTTTWGGGHAFASPPLGRITEAQRNCYLFRVTPQLGERAGPSTSIFLFIPTLLNY